MRLAVIERVKELMTAAFSLVAALAWNDAVQALFKTVFGEVGSLYAKFLYAIIVTLITVWVIHRLMKTSRAMRQRLDVAEKDIKA